VINKNSDKKRISAFSGPENVGNSEDLQELNVTCN